MKLVPALLLALTAASCSLFSGRTPPPSSIEVADSDLIAQVCFALKRAGIPDYQEIRIEADGGTVTLRGPARSSEVIENAVSAASKVKGVKRVESHLDGGGTPPAGIPSERT